MRISDWSSDVCSSDLGNSLCGPSRATMLTGRQSNAHGFTQNGQHFDNSSWVWPRALAQAGYTTAMFGKWHINGTPKGIGFDDWKDRKSTRLNPVTNAHLVCRLLLEKKNSM